MGAELSTNNVYIYIYTHVSMYSIHFLSCKNAWKYPECQTGLTIVDDSKAAAHGQCHVED